METLLTIVLLGFVLGLQHATDPDHLVAVATIVARERRLRDGTLVGVLWGLGHMATVTAAGALVVSMGGLGPAVAGGGLELVVALLLVALGVARLRDAFRGYPDAAPPAEATDHDHGGLERLHRHPRAGDAGGIPHVHPSRDLVTALASRGRRLIGRTLLVGVVHGLAGSAGASLLVVATIESTAWALAYLLVFGLGTILGMALLAGVMAYPVSLAARFERGRRALSAVAGVGAIAFGVAYGIRAI